MAVLQEFKCPCCDGAIAFDSGSQKMKCPYCDAEFDVEAIKSCQNSTEAVDFKNAYLAGYFADQYDVDAKAGIVRANERIKASTAARDYSRAVAPRLTTNTETYLYSTMSSRPRVKLNLNEYSGSRSHGGFSGGSAGGSTTHRSSSGRRHGGRGGKF